MRRIYSELILKPSLIICAFGGLSACSDKAFQSAVYTDPSREKHSKSSVDVETAKDAKSNKARWEKALKKKHSKKFEPQDDEKEVVVKDETQKETSDKKNEGGDDALVVPRVIPTPSEEAKTGEFETRRSRSRRSAKKESAEVVKTPETKSTTDDSVLKKQLQLDFTTESVDGISSTAVLKNLTNVSNLSSDLTANLESLNQGSFHIELTPRDDMTDRYSAIAALTLIVQTESDDPALDSNEVTKTLRLTNLGNVIKSAQGYEALLKYGSKKFLRVKISTKEDSKKPRSGEIWLVQDDGSERKILTLIQEN